MSQRVIIKVSNTYPWEGCEIRTNKALLGNDAPPISIRRKAASNNWWIERKEYGPTTLKVGRTYWQFIKDPSSVSYLVNANTSIPPLQEAESKTKTKERPIPKRKKSTKVWSDRNWTIESKQYKSRTIKDLLTSKNIPSSVPDSFSNDEDIVNFINDSVKFKPSFMILDKTKWQLLVRASIRGDNVEIRGDKGEGKTMSVYALANALKRQLFPINFGHMQDAQTALIGKTHLDSTKGTFFSKSYFVEAITTPDSIVLMDELSRGTDDAFNIIMPVLDRNQRYLRLNDEVNSPKVEVAPGVCFIATSNIGHIYSATRQLDAALSDRFTTKIEVDILNVRQRSSIISSIFPALSDSVVEQIAIFANDINQKVYSGNGELSYPISTRTCIAIAAIIYDGINILDAIENTVYPDYSDESERTYLKQLIQGYGLNDFSKNKQIYKSQVKN